MTQSATVSGFSTRDMPERIDVAAGDTIRRA
jgi:hypothetical protein